MCVCVCEGRWEGLLKKSWSEGEAFGQETAVQDYHICETTPVMWGRAARVVWVLILSVNSHKPDNSLLQTWHSIVVLP